MFTGLIECLGTVRSINRSGTSIKICIAPGAEDYIVPEGGSVSIDGVCLTVEKCDGEVLHFSAVAETLKRTTLGDAVPGRKVNLERAMKLGDRLDGHLVLGHIDGTGVIVRDRDLNGSIQRSIRVPLELMPLMAVKGSVAIDGISLTIASTGTEEITISLIPLTINSTTMAYKRTGDSVNIEIDVLARYVSNLVQKNTGLQEDTLLTKLEGLGY
ncbi:MAG: riboflavin synthase [Fibrobacter sp.]|jgi:riboflavin synthase|nr:riboflavin synthase [Fibrobacter sp.]